MQSSLNTQGCQIFVATIYQNGEKYPKWQTKNTKRPQNVPKFSIPRPANYTKIGIFGSKIHIPSGNPVRIGSPKNDLFTKFYGSNENGRKTKQSHPEWS
jgi:hypothetical protein